MPSSRFRVAIHILSVLAHGQDRPFSSDVIAGSVNTNPVVIRRVLGLLSKARLVRTIQGTGGGATLARPADEITIGDVYQATEGGSELFSMPRSEPNPHCTIGQSIHDVLEQHLSRFEEAMEREMNKTTLADVVQGIREVAKA